jgi:hypothetical protein
MPFVVQTSTPAHVTAVYNKAQGILRRVQPTRTGTNGQVLAQMPKTLQPDDVGEDGRGPARVSDIARNVFVDPAEKSAWDAALADILHSSTNEIALRQGLFSAVQSSTLEPVAARLIMQRAVKLWRSQRAKA